MRVGRHSANEFAIQERAEWEESERKKAEDAATRTAAERAEEQRAKEEHRAKLRARVAEPLDATGFGHVLKDVKRVKKLDDASMDDIKATYRAFVQQVPKAAGPEVRKVLIDFIALQTPPLDPRDVAAWGISYECLKLAEMLPEDAEREKTRTRLAEEERNRPVIKQPQDIVTYKDNDGKEYRGLDAIKAMPSAEMRKRLIDREFSRAVDELLGVPYRAPEVPDTSKQESERETYNSAIVLRGFEGKDWTQRMIDEDMPSELYKKAMTIVTGKSVHSVADAIKANDGVLQAAREQHRAHYGR